MKTKRCISTISYNTKNYLLYTLNRLIASGYIDSFAFVEHKAEEDEKKDHFHLFLEPSKSIDTSWLCGEFLEPLPDELPLRVLPFRLSKFDDWYLYSKHDITYLESKNMFRHFHYDFDDFTFSDEDYFADLVRFIDMSKYTSSKRFIQAVFDGYTFPECVKMGLVPLASVISYREAYYELHGVEFKKNKKKC